jgi:hypothetical protein
MFKKSAARVLAVGVVAAALVASSSVAANAALSTPPGTIAPFYLIDSLTGEAVPPGSSLSWTTDVSGNPSANNVAFDEVFTGPADAEGVVPFISPRGSEKSPSAWIAYGVGGFADVAAKTVLMSPAKLDSMTMGVSGANGVKAQGGDYSLGFAFVRNNALNVASDAVYFTHISITAGTGAWTFDTPADTTPQPPADNTFDVDLDAEVTAVPEGTLSLEAPALGTATIGNPQIVGGKSTSTGELGAFTVKDERYQSHPGWTVTSSVTDFTNSGDTTKVIEAGQLSIAPAFAGTPNTAVTLASAHAAVKAPTGALFAQSNNTTASGEVSLKAGLTFVAPANMPAGTYTSKLTVTLASK